MANQAMGPAGIAHMMTVMDHLPRRQATDAGVLKAFDWLSPRHEKKLGYRGPSRRGQQFNSSRWPKIRFLLSQRRASFEDMPNLIDQRLYIRWPSDDVFSRKGRRRLHRSNIPRKQ